MKWVKLKKYCQDSGDTSHAVHAKRKRGIWLDGVQCRETLRLDQALNDGVIERNPLDKLVLSKLINKKTSHSSWEVDPFDQEEIKAILNEAGKISGQASNLFQFAFFAGLRTSELIALEWGDIDWLKGLVRVSRAVVLKQEKGTKTKHGTFLKLVGYSIILVPIPLGRLMHKFVKLVGRIFYERRGFGILYNKLVHLQIITLLSTNNLLIFTKLVFKNARKNENTFASTRL